MWEVKTHFVDWEATAQEFATAKQADDFAKGESEKPDVDFVSVTNFPHVYIFIDGQAR